MPKIFLIKNRLHQQQLKLLESQNLTHKDDQSGLNIIYNDSEQCDSAGNPRPGPGPLSLVAKKDDNKWKYDNLSKQGNSEGKNLCTKPHFSRRSIFCVQRKSRWSHIELPTRYIGKTHRIAHHVDGIRFHLNWNSPLIGQSARRLSALPESNSSTLIGF